ncbi:MAG TPA: TetR/AcrR family transcriptional regulator [Solirubrobacterales bacterium]|nr:TetR/AcrR family transcriptional regulator [Solirubrobacterales bacterium]
MARLPQALRGTPVGTTRLSREELSERQLRRILDGAVRVFARRGFQDSTVDNIITAADVGVGSFYAHFDGKEECLDKVCERISAEAGDALTRALDGGGWTERFCDGMLALLRFAAANPLSARVVLLEAQTGGPRVLARYGAMIDEIAAYLAQGREVSTLDRDWPPAFEEATASGLFWLLQSRLVRGELEEVDSLFAEMAEVALEPYLGPAATRRAVGAALARAS